MRRRGWLADYESPVRAVRGQDGRADMSCVGKERQLESECSSVGVQCDDVHVC